MGKFQPGNPGGPGGPRAGAGRKPSEARAAADRLFGGVSEKDLQAVIARAVADAKGGDAAARNWLSDRVFGKVAAPDVLAALEEVHAEAEAFRGAVLSVLAEVDPAARERLVARLARRAGDEEAAAERDENHR